MGGWSWEQRVADSYWSRQSAVGETRLLDSVSRVAGHDVQVREGAVPGIEELALGAASVREPAPGGADIREEAGLSRFRYSARSKGFNLLALRDRVSNSRLPDGVRPVARGTPACRTRRMG